MLRLRKIDLKEAGIEYVRACLLKAGSGLCAHLTLSSLLQGNIYTILPEGITVDRAMQFTVGGLMAMNHVQTWLADHIYALTAIYPNGMFVIQDAFGRRFGDSSVKKIKSNHFFDKCNTYYFVDAAIIDNRSVGNALLDNTSYMLLGFFMNKIDRILTNGNMYDDQLTHELARNVQEIYVGAYDQESVVVHRRFQ